MARQDTQFQEAPPQDTGGDWTLPNDPFGLGGDTTPADAGRAPDNVADNPYGSDFQTPEERVQNPIEPAHSAWSDVAQNYTSEEPTQPTAQNTSPWADLTPATEAAPQQAESTDKTPTNAQVPQIDATGHDVSPQEAGTYDPQGVVDFGNQQLDTLGGFEGQGNDLNTKQNDLNARMQQYVDEVNTGIRPSQDAQMEGSLQGEQAALDAAIADYRKNLDTQKARTDTAIADANATATGEAQKFLGDVGTVAGESALQGINRQAIDTIGSDQANVQQAQNDAISWMANDPQGYMNSLGVQPDNTVTLPSGQIVQRVDDGAGYSTWTLPGADSKDVAGYWKDSAGNWNPANAQDLSLLHASGFAVTSKTNAASIAAQAYQQTGTQPTDLIKGYSEAWKALSENDVTNAAFTPLGKAALAALNTRAGQAVDMIITAAMLPTGAGIASSPSDILKFSLKEALKSYLINGPNLGLEGVGFKPTQWLGIENQPLAAPPAGMALDALMHLRDDPKGFVQHMYDAMFHPSTENGPVSTWETFKDKMFTPNPTQVAREQGLASTLTNVDPFLGMGGKAQAVGTLANILVGDIHNRVDGWHNIDPTRQFQDYLTRGQQNLESGMPPAAAYDQAFKDTALGWATTFWEFNLRNPTYNIATSPLLEDFISRGFGVGQRKLAEFGKWALDSGLQFPALATRGQYGTGLANAAEQTSLFFRRLSQEAGMNAVSSKLFESLQTLLPSRRFVEQKIIRDAINNFGQMILSRLSGDNPTFADLARHHLDFFNGIPGLEGGHAALNTLVDTVLDGVRVRARQQGIPAEALARGLQDRLGALADPTVTLSPGMQSTIDNILSTTDRLFNRSAGQDLRRLSAVKEINDLVDTGLRSQFGLDTKLEGSYQKALSLLRTAFLVPSAPFLAVRKLVDEAMRSSVIGSYGLNPGDLTTVQNIGAFLRDRTNPAARSLGQSIATSSAVGRALEKGVVVPSRVTALTPKSWKEPGQKIVQTLVSETTRHAASNVFSNAIAHDPALLSHALGFTSELSAAGAPQQVLDMANRIVGVQGKSPAIQAQYYQTANDLLKRGTEVSTGRFANAINPGRVGVAPGGYTTRTQGQLLMDRLMGRIHPAINDVLAMRLPKDASGVSKFADRFMKKLDTVPPAERQFVVDQFVRFPGAGKNEVTGQAFVDELVNRGVLTKDYLYGKNAMRTAPEGGVNLGGAEAGMNQRAGGGITPLSESAFGPYPKANPIDENLSRAFTAKNRNLDPQAADQILHGDGSMLPYEGTYGPRKLGENAPPIAKPEVPSPSMFYDRTPPNPISRANKADKNARGNPLAGRSFKPGEAASPTDILNTADQTAQQGALGQAADQWQYGQAAGQQIQPRVPPPTPYAGKPLGLPQGTNPNWNPGKFGGPIYPPPPGVPLGPTIPTGAAAHSPQQYEDWARIFRKYGDLRMEINAATAERGVQAINRSIGELGAHSAAAEGFVKNLYPFADFHLNSTAINGMNLARRPLAAVLINSYLNSTTDQNGRDVLQRTQVPLIGSLDKMYTLAHMIEYGRQLGKYATDVANAPGNNPIQKGAKIAAEPFVGSGAYLGTFPWVDRPANVLLGKTTNPLRDARGNVDYRDAIAPNQDYGTLEGLARMGVDQLPNSVSPGVRGFLRDKSGIAVNPGGKVGNLIAEGLTKGLNELPGKNVVTPDKDPLKDLPYRARDLAAQMGWNRGDTARIQAAVNDVSGTKGQPSTQDGQDLLRQIQYAKDAEMAHLGVNPINDSGVQMREAQYGTGSKQTEKDVQNALNELRRQEEQAWQTLYASDLGTPEHDAAMKAWEESKKNFALGVETYKKTQDAAKNDPNSPVFPANTDGSYQPAYVNPAVGTDSTKSFVDENGKRIFLGASPSYESKSYPQMEENAGAAVIKSNLDLYPYRPQSVIDSNLLAGQPRYSQYAYGGTGKAESQFGATSEENLARAMEAQRAAKTGNYLSTPEQLANGQLSSDQLAYLKVKDAGMSPTKVGEGTPIAVNELLRQPGNYYDTIGKAINESDPAKKNALFARSEELKNQSPETTAFFQAQQDGQWKRLQLRRDEYLSRPDVQDALKLPGTTISGVKNGQTFSYNPIHDESLQPRPGSPSIQKDKLYYDQWNDSQRQAYDQYNAYLGSDEHKAYKSLEDQLAAVGGYDSAKGKQWYKDHAQEYITAENVANARLAGIAKQTGVNPLEMASAVAVAEGKPAYTSTKIPEQKPINQYPSTSKTGQQGISVTGGGTNAKGSNKGGSTGRSVEVQAAVDAGNRFYDFWSHGDLTGAEKHAISMAERDVSDVLGKGKKPSAEAYDAALQRAQQRLDKIRASKSGNNDSATGQPTTASGRFDTSTGGIRPDLIAQYGSDAPRIQRAIERKSNPIADYAVQNGPGSGNRTTAPSYSPWANLAPVKKPNAFAGFHR